MTPKLRIPRSASNDSGMTLYRRRLPHDYETSRAIFLTWRLHDSLPPNRAFPGRPPGSARVPLDPLLANEMRSTPEDGATGGAPADQGVRPTGGQKLPRRR
jgi:hypothetical protein